MAVTTEPGSSCLARGISPVTRADAWLLREISSRENPVLQSAMRSLSRAAEHGIVWVVLSLLMAALDGHRRRSWLLACLCAPLSILLNFALKKAVRRPRPELRREVRGLVRSGSPSFPSAHATSSFAVATVARRIDTRTHAPALTLAAVISFSRVYLGLHYPADVFAGGLIGTAVGKGMVSLVAAHGNVPR